jgi:hypothetical protein
MEPCLGPGSDLAATERPDRYCSAILFGSMDDERKRTWAWLVGDSTLLSAAYVLWDGKATLQSLLFGSPCMILAGAMQSLLFESLRALAGWAWALLLSNAVPR